MMHDQRGVLIWGYSSMIGKAISISAIAECLFIVMLQAGNSADPCVLARLFTIKIGRSETTDGVNSGCSQVRRSIIIPMSDIREELYDGKDVNCLN